MFSNNNPSILSNTATTSTFNTNTNTFTTNSMYVIKRTGDKEEVCFEKCQHRIVKLSKDLKVNPFEIAQQVILQIYDGVPTWKLDELAAELCAAKMTTHPDYGRLASRIIISRHHKTTSPSYSEVIQSLWDNKDIHGVHTPLINLRLYNMVKANSTKINDVIDYTKDYNYDYFGFKTLERAYLLRIGSRVIERPQHMLMRIALSIHKDDLKEAVKVYKAMSEGYFTHATPTMFNMGTQREQASSCFLLNIDSDSIDGIYKTISDCAKISQHSGGIGVAVHKIRSKGATIRGTNGHSNGIVPMLKVFNETARYVNQGGKRNGSFAVYLEPWHADFEDFLLMRRETTVETARAIDLFYAVWMPDLFMKRLRDGGDWTMMCPDKCPGLNTTFGDEFEALYAKYEAEGRGERVVKASKIWEMILDSQTETGTPYILYKDAVNKKNNQANLGTIECSNLCAEIVEYTSAKQVAVCNLASMALQKFVEINATTNERVFNFDKFHDMVKMVVRNLNKIIDYNFYPVTEAEDSNKLNRPIGLGVQGLADVFALLKVPFDSPNAIELNRKIFERMYFAACESSMELAKKRKKVVQEYKRLLKIGTGVDANGSPYHTVEDTLNLAKLKSENHILDAEVEKLPNTLAGAYSSFVGSPAHQGRLQFDLWGIEPSADLSEKWSELKGDIMKHGMRNSLLVALMPTASTSQIIGSNECFEPFTNNIYSRKTLVGTFTIINKYLINDLLELGLWNINMKNRIIAANGSVQEIDEIPQPIKELYKTVWELKQKSIIDLAATRAPFVDQTQSMNLWMKDPSYSKLSSMHMYSWMKGLKTGIYYLRTQAKSSAAKISLDQEKMDVKNNNSDNSTHQQPHQQMQSQTHVQPKEEPECLMCSA